jgi:hypothetical protein
MEIFKYEYNLSRKNIKNNKPIYTLIVFVRDSEIVHTMQIASFALLFEA